MAVYISGIVAALIGEDTCTLCDKRIHAHELTEPIVTIVDSESTHGTAHVRCIAAAETELIDVTLNGLMFDDFEHMNPDYLPA